MPRKHGEGRSKESEQTDMMNNVSRLSEARATELSTITSKFRVHVVLYYGNIKTWEDESGKRGPLNADGYSSAEQEAIDSR